MKDGESKRISIAVGLSITAHALIAVLLVLAPSVLPRDERALEAEITIEIAEPDEPPPEIAPEPIPEPIAEPEPSPSRSPSPSR
ncbi:MAG: hypothetical protein M3Y87_31970 [Myxococcota bacterium]|nr:hypothetical protein [Myxococcota bacterium]